MAVIPFIALSLAMASQPVASGYARLASELVRSASRLHVGAGWGAHLSATGQASPRVWSPSWEWRTAAMLPVELDGATEWRMRVYGVATGDVYVRGAPIGAGVLHTGAVVDVPAQPVEVAPGQFALVLQVRSTARGSSSTASVVWGAGGFAQLPSDPGYAAEFSDGADRHAVMYGFAAGGGWAVVPWPVRGSSDSDRTYTVQPLSYLTLLGVYGYGESDGTGLPDVAGLTPTRALQELAIRSLTADLLARTPYQQIAAVAATDYSVTDQWARLIDLPGGATLYDGPVDEQGGYAITIPVMHDQLGDVEVTVEVDVGGVTEVVQAFAVPPSQIDTGNGGSFLRWRLLYPQYPIPDAWRGDEFAYLTVQVDQPGTPGDIAVRVSGGSGVLAVLPLAIVPQRQRPPTMRLPTGTRITSLAAMAQAAEAPWTTLRREIATWTLLFPNVSSVAGIAYQATQTPTVMATVQARSDDVDITVTFTEPDGVTVAGTVSLSGTNPEGSVELPGGTWYYVSVDTVDGGAGYVDALRIFEGPSMAVLSIEYASRATLLADTGQSAGATGYVPSYAAPTMVRQWDGAAWIVVSEIWDGVTSGQTVADLATTGGVENGIICFPGADAVYQYDGAAWVGIPTVLTGTNFYALPTAGVVAGSLAELPYGVYRWSGTAWELLATQDYPVEATASDDLFLVDTFRMDNNFLLVPEA